MRPLSNLLATDGIKGRLGWPKQAHIDGLCEGVLGLLVDRRVAVEEVWEMLGTFSLM